MSTSGKVKAVTSSGGDAANSQPPAAATSSAAVLDNWEEMDETDLDSKLKQIKQRTANLNQNAINSSGCASMAATVAGASASPRIGGILPRPQNNGHTGLLQQQQQPSAANSPQLSAALQETPTIGGGGSSGGGPIKLLPKDDDYGGHTRRSIEPIVKILRRPEHERTSPLVNEVRRPPVKSLQQREQEYAEARLRIMGAAHSVEQPVAAPAAATVAATTASTTAATTTTTNNRLNHQTMHHQQQQQQTQQQQQQHQQHNYPQQPYHNNHHPNNHQYQYPQHHQQHPQQQQPQFNQQHYQHYNQQQHQQHQSTAYQSNGSGGLITNNGPSIRRPLLADNPAAAIAAGIIRQPRGPSDGLTGGFAYRR